MSFLAAGYGVETSSLIQGSGLILRPFTTGDYSRWARLRDESRAHLNPWEPTWTTSELSQSAFRHRVRHYRREARDDLGYAFAITNETTLDLLGGITLSNVRRGVSQTASLGYWIGAPYKRRSIMTRTVANLIPYAFKELRLHRLEAATMPSNSASIKVLERNGFVREGFARRLLKINGVWQDHILFGLLADEFKLSETKTG